MFDSEEEYNTHELPLDTDLVRFYLYKRSQMHFTEDRHEQYSTELWSLLSDDIDQTMDFLRDCESDELAELWDVIEDLIFDFKEDKSPEKYNEFIEFLQELGEDHPHSDLKEHMEFILKYIQDTAKEEQA